MQDEFHPLGEYRVPHRVRREHHYSRPLGGPTPMAEVLASIEDEPESGCVRISVQILDASTGEYHTAEQRITRGEILRRGVLEQILPYLVRSFQEHGQQDNAPTRRI